MGSPAEGVRPLPPQKPLCDTLLTLAKLMAKSERSSAPGALSPTSVIGRHSQSIVRVAQLFLHVED